MSVSVAGNQTADDGCIGVVETQYYTFAHPPNELKLECGKSLGPVTLAYETYGRLNADKSNAILVVHALSGDAHAAGVHKGENNPGWWDDMIGPGKAFDTNKYFIICSNILGGCKGTTGPASVNPETGHPWGLSFPIVTIEDMVRVQAELLDHLGIEKILTVAGGSVGAMQALEWSLAYPERALSSMVIAGAARINAQAIAFNAVGRAAILSDPNFNDGQYYEAGIGPDTGLAIARMIGHITYLSDESMHAKFGRTLRERTGYGYDFESEFSIETYLDYQGRAFVDRFDANSYLYLTKAMDYYDVAAPYDGDLTPVFKDTTSRYLIVSISSDWLFPTYQSKEIVSALMKNDKEVTFVELKSRYGHDAFLLEVETLRRVVSSFLDGVVRDLNPKPENASTKGAAQ